MAWELVSGLHHRLTSLALYLQISLWSTVLCEAALWKIPLYYSALLGGSTEAV